MNDVRKKWHIPPAFSVEFIGYYLDRISRSTEVKKNLQEQLELNKTLVSDQQSLREKYDEVLENFTKAGIIFGIEYETIKIPLIFSVLRFVKSMSTRDAN